MEESYREFRPSNFDEVVGQDRVVATLKKFLDNNKLPHATMFSGPSGCGKTSLARVTAKELGCGDADFAEINCGVVKAMETVREIRETMGLAAMTGKVRVFYLDEAQTLSRAKAAQEAMLKMLEDPPKHCYFILATTEPQKIIKTVKSRCTQFFLKPLQESDLHLVLKRIANNAEVKVYDEVRNKIIELCEGNARNAVVMLDQAMQHKGKGEQLNSIESEETREAGIAIARVLFKRRQWREVAATIRAVNEDPETIRRIILGYANTILLSGSKLSSFAYFVIQVFRDHWYDCGKAGLAACCYEVTTAK